MAASGRETAHSATIEGDARRASSDSSRVSSGEIAIGVVIGRTSEFFDFFVYGIASVLVFPQLVFPFVEDRLTGTLYSFAIFSLAFIARPIGSVAFMAIDRRHGRGVKLTIALFLLGSSTAAVSFLPGYDEIGVASIAILSICRIGQGLALGGAWDGLSSLLALNAPHAKRGWYAMMPQLGAPIGFVLASALFAFFLVNLSADDFLSWGWRYPFFCAFAINVVALFARLRLVATEEFARLLERRDLVPIRVSEMIREQGRNVIIGAFVPLGCYALFHLVTIFPLSWILLSTDQTPADVLMMQLVGAIVCAVAIVLSGLIADRIGRRNLLAIGACGIAIFSFVTPVLLGGGPTGQTTFIVVGFALLGLSLGQSSGAVSSSFTSQNRYTGAALTSDLAWLIGAGFAPLVALGFSTRFGLAATGAYLLSGAVCSLVALYINRKLDAKDQ